MRETEKKRDKDRQGCVLSILLSFLFFFPDPGVMKSWTVKERGETERWREGERERERERERE